MSWHFTRLTVQHYLIYLIRRYSVQPILKLCLLAITLLLIANSSRYFRFGLIDLKQNLSLLVIAKRHSA